jgi:GDPmannose 4,6-dehydratase
MRCLVIGGSGQDGVLLAAQLLAEGHRVITVSRRPVPLGDVDHRIADAADRTALAAIVADATPDEVYFLAAHHRSSQDASPPLDADVAGCLTVNAVAFGSLLAAIARHAPTARTLYASSCRIFGLGDGRLLDETAVKSPICPYGVSKVAGMSIAHLYRRERGMFVSSAILFNHESELRPDSFLSKKLALTALAARNDPAVRVQVGSFDDAADWGSARDYVAAMRCILRADVARDYIVASGVLRTVREFAEVCFGSLGLDWTKHVVAAAADGRPRWRLRGDATKLMAHTDWRPAFDFPGMVLDLVTRTDRYERQRPAGFHSYL